MFPFAKQQTISSLSLEVVKHLISLSKSRILEAKVFSSTINKFLSIAITILPF
jgi:hypothetical protein